MTQSNAAFLTKLGWRLISKPTSLWSRVVRSKYCHGLCDVDMFKASSNCSNLWKGIVANAPFVMQGSQVAVGNGQTTLFWNHKWATNHPLIEFWAGNGIASEYLPLSALKQIQAHEVSYQNDLSDALFWNAGPNGNFSIKSSLSIIRNDSHSNPDPHWGLVWSAVAQNRGRFFIWLAMHNRLLCNENRMKRHLTDDSSCGLCNHETESILHMLRDCEHAKVIWNKVCHQRIKQDFFGCNDPKEWIANHAQCPRASNPDSWAITFPLTLWWIWKWRNQSLFIYGANIPLDEVAFIKDKVAETCNALCNERLQAISSIQQQQIYIQWKPPCYGWVALNTDGAAKGCPGAAGAGGILRDHRGICISFFFANLHTCTAIKAELLALKHGLEIAWSKNIQQVDVRLDSKACMQILERDNDYQGPNMQIIKLCKQIILRLEWIVTLTHCYRESNKAADWLSNHGISHDSRLEIDTVPP
ncbi:hypothetical protein RDABS01_030349 [Bienertia sinuspersici]